MSWIASLDSLAGHGRERRIVVLALVLLTALAWLYLWLAPMPMPATHGGLRAPLLHLQAGRTRILARQTALGMPSLRRGLELLAQRQQFARLQNAGQRVIAELQEHELTQEANEISAFLHSKSPSIEEQSAPAIRPILPTHCPQCGAMLRPDEIEWLDESTGECGHCGSRVREDS